MDETATGEEAQEARPGSGQEGPDRVIVLGLLAGAWWALLLGEIVEAEAYRRDAAHLSGPDWDVRAAADVSGEKPVPYPRALRQARGVGRRRSMDLARYFQAFGRDAPPDGLYGVGKTTAAAAAAALDELEMAFALRAQSASARDEPPDLGDPR